MQPELYRDIVIATEPFPLSEMLVFNGAFFTTIGRNRLVSMHFVFTDASYDRRLVLTEREYRNDGLLPRCDGPLLERKRVVSIG